MPEPTHPPADFSWRVLLITAYLPTLLVSIGFGAVVPLIAVSAIDLGASPGMAAFVVGVYGLGGLLADLPAGAIAARFGEKRSMIGACVIEAAAMILAWQSQQLWLFIVAIAVAGACASMVQLARQAYLLVAVPIHLRARAMSGLGGTFRIGWFIGPLIAAGVVAAFDTRAAYVAAAIMSLASALIMLALPEPEGARAVTEDTGPRLGTVIRENRKSLLTLGIGAMVLMLVRAARLTIVPLWAAQQGVPPHLISLFFAAAGLAEIVMTLPSGWVMDRYGRFWAAVPTLLALAIGFAVLPLATTAWAIGLVAFWIGLGNGFSAGVVMTLGADTAPKNARQRYLAVWRLMVDGGNAAGPLLVTATVAAAPLWGSALLAAAVCLAGAGWFTRWLPRRPGPVSVLE
ncbi:MFS transporter [Granulicoccus phenolivorans]|uniref:MFS transporter n=1 Tax=Granulicoccus phenolivorans TaxID=266854 RepID=UPI000407FBBE|nr:MFS transporter [Granulicoccus phenolivorans]